MDENNYSTEQKLGSNLPLPTNSTSDAASIRPRLDGFSPNFIESTYHKMDTISFFDVIECLLKYPGKVVYEIRNQPGLYLLFTLMNILLVNMLLYGFLAGTFSGGVQLLYVPVKIAGGACFTSLLCLPSLYIFIVMNGASVSLKEVSGLLLAAMCLSSIVLIGLSPVIWIFSQSTNSAEFMGALHIIVWLIALILGMRIVFKSTQFISKQKCDCLVLWLIIFTVVSLQMTTMLRPLIGKPNKFFDSEKKFFLIYWSECIDKKDR